MLCLGHRFNSRLSGGVGGVQAAGARMPEMHKLADLYEGEATSLHHDHRRHVLACRRIGPKESRHKSNDGESLTYVLFKYFGGFLNFVPTLGVTCTPQLLLLCSPACFLDSVEWAPGHLLCLFQRSRSYMGFSLRHGGLAV